MNNSLKILSAMAIGAFLVSCKSESDQPKRTSFFDVTGMDSTAKPTDDFFQYANGGWMKNTQIPADQTGWGSFYTLYEDN